MSRCASLASASGKVAKITGRTLPEASSGQTFSRTASATAAFCATVLDLKKAGITCEIFGFFKQDELGIWIAPGGTQVAWFKDPDGNILSVSQHA